MKGVISQWYELYVEPDAKATTENRYPGKPEVSQIDSDGFSQGENTYMLVSINTVDSLRSVKGQSANLLLSPRTSVPSNRHLNPR
jgi:hypothetical protein